MQIQGHAGGSFAWRLRAAVVRVWKVTGKPFFSRVIVAPRGRPCTETADFQGAQVGRKYGVTYPSGPSHAELRAAAQVDAAVSLRLQTWSEIVSDTLRSERLPRLEPGERILLASLAAALGIAAEDARRLERYLAEVEA